MNLDALAAEDYLDGLSELELLDLYRRVRTMLAARLGGADGSESLEMLFARMAEVVDPPAPTPSRVSAREREVLQLLAKGASTDTIAASLFLSPHTVKAHVRNVFSKYEVRSRQEAVFAAIKAGDLTVD